MFGLLGEIFDLGSTKALGESIVFFVTCILRSILVCSIFPVIVV
jgi:hypothetical protein